MAKLYFILLLCETYDRVIQQSQTAKLRQGRQPLKTPFSLEQTSVLGLDLKPPHAMVAWANQSLKTSSSSVQSKNYNLYYTQCKHIHTVF